MSVVAYGTITLWGAAFQRLLLTDNLVTFLTYNVTLLSYNCHDNLSRLWATARSLAATDAISIDFFSSGY